MLFPVIIEEEARRARLLMIRTRWNFCTNRDDYQSGTEFPHSKG
jgi:hypothetical protein